GNMSSVLPVAHHGNRLLFLLSYAEPRQNQAKKAARGRLFQQPEKGRPPGLPFLLFKILFV
ncbi:hypothetical protein C6Y45_00005, partial [Alkalicoccus saliphilus]